MKNLYAAFAFLLCISSVSCYAQGSPVKKPQPKVEEKDELIEQWGDISIDVAVPMPDEPHDDARIYERMNVQVLPEFPGGTNALLAYLDKNIRKNVFDKDCVLSSKTYASFIIEKDGSTSDIQILRDPGYGIGKEVLRTLKSMKQKWSPGIQNGKPVRVRYTLPITVTLP